VLQESQTKNDYLRGMITELGWGLQPLMVTSDAWYSSGDKPLKDKELGFLIGIAKTEKSQSIVENTPKSKL